MCSTQFSFCRPSSFASMNQKHPIQWATRMVTKENPMNWTWECLKR